MKRHLLQLAITLLLVSSSSAYYQAEQGRWLNRDPIGEKGGSNLYGMLENAIVIAVDAHGLASAFTGDISGAYTMFYINKARAALQAEIDRLKGLTHSTGVACYKVETSDAGHSRLDGSADDARNAARNADYSLIDAHYDERTFKNTGVRVRVFVNIQSRNGAFEGEDLVPDQDLRDAASENGNQCTIYGCYAEPHSPNSNSGIVDSLTQMADDLKKIDKCGQDECKTELIILVFAED